MVALSAMKEGLEQNNSDNYGSSDRNRSFGSHLKEYAKSSCSIATLKKRVPIFQWLPTYSIVLLLQDALAGITVGLTAIPQGIAYAVVAGLEPQYGLYAGFMGCFVYLILGSCKDITIGPTAILSLMVQKHVRGQNADYAVLVTFLSGVIILLLGLLHLGFLVQFISVPVTVGFTSGAAMTILASQLKSVFGIVDVDHECEREDMSTCTLSNIANIRAISGSSNDFMEAIGNIIKNFHTIKLWDSILGLSTIIILLVLKYLNKYSSRTDTDGFSTAKNVLWKFNWFISLSRNAIVVIAGILIAWWLKTQKGIEPFTLTGNIKEGLPPFQLPPFSTVVGNETRTFTDMVSELGSSLVTLPLISILESIAIAKAFSNGKIVDATQEMVALGVCNIFGSFFRSMPTTGSFTRTAINNSSGVQTQAGGLFTGCLVLLALGLLTQTFYFIPKATLAGLIVCAMLFMVEYQMAITLWKTRKLELFVMLITFSGCLVFGLEIGICVGVASDAIVLLLKVARPAFTSKYYKVGEIGVLVVNIPRSMYYCAADHLTQRLLAAVDDYPDAILVIDCSNMTNIDTTVAKSFKSLIEDMKARSQEIIFWRLSFQTKDILLKLVPTIESKISQEFTVDDVLNSIIRPLPVTDRS